MTKPDACHGSRCSFLTGKQTEPSARRCRHVTQARPPGPFKSARHTLPAVIKYVQQEAGNRMGRREFITGLAWVAALIFMFSGETAAQPNSGQLKKILFLHTFGPNFEQGAAWNREIQRELNRQSPWPLNIQDQSLVAALDGDSDADAKFIEYLGTLYAQRPPDLIVALGAPAANFVQEHRTKLFPTTPMLLAAVEVRRVVQAMLSEQDAVAGVRYDEVAAIENVLRLLPETKTI